MGLIGLCMGLIGLGMGLIGLCMGLIGLGMGLIGLCSVEMILQILISESNYTNFSILSSVLHSFYCRF